MGKTTDLVIHFFKFKGNKNCLFLHTIKQLFEMSTENKRGHVKTEFKKEK